MGGISIVGRRERASAVGCPGSKAGVDVVVECRGEKVEGEKLDPTLKRFFLLFFFFFFFYFMYSLLRYKNSHAVLAMA